MTREEAIICLIENEALEMAIQTLMQEPARIHAKWKAADAYNYKCSKCKQIAPWDYAYCPYCGAKMESEE